MQRDIKADRGAKLLKATAFIAATLLSCLLLSCGKAKDEDFTYKCTLCIECRAVLSNMDKFKSDKLEALPKDGVILEKSEVGFNGGESVYDVFIREVRSRRIHAETYTMPGTGDVYIEGINNIYEFDCGGGSGWLYSVNGAFQSRSCSGYKLEDGDEVCFVYTCSAGEDVGGGVGAGIKN